MIQQISHRDDFMFERANDHVPCMKSNHIIQGMCQIGEVSTLVAASNTGKTALAVAIGAKVARGEPILGRPTRKGAVMHFCGEGHTAVKDRVSVLLHDQQDAFDYFTTGRMVDLSDLESMKRLIDQVRRELAKLDQPLSLIIVDTFVMSIGDLCENNSAEMTRAVTRARQFAEAFDAHCMFTHHTGRDEARGGRGSSAILASIDSEFHLKKIDGGRVELTQVKQRNLEKGTGLSFRLRKITLGRDEFDHPRTTIVADFSEGSKKMTPQASRIPDNGDVAICTALNVSAHLGTPTLSTRQLKNWSALPSWASNPDEQAQLTGCLNRLKKLEGFGRLTSERSGRELRWRLTSEITESSEAMSNTAPTVGTVLLAREKTGFSGE